MKFVAAFFFLLLASVCFAQDSPQLRQLCGTSQLAANLESPMQELCGSMRSAEKLAQDYRVAFDNWRRGKKFHAAMYAVASLEARARNMKDDAIFAMARASVTASVLFLGESARHEIFVGWERQMKKSLEWKTAHFEKNRAAR